MATEWDRHVWDERGRRRVTSNDDDERGRRRYGQEERDMRSSYRGYSGADDWERGRMRGYGMEGEYGGERYRPYGEDRRYGSEEYGGEGERYGGNYGNPSRYSDRSQMGGRWDESERYGGSYRSPSRYGERSQMGRWDESERYGSGYQGSEYGSEGRYGQGQQSGPHRGAGPKGYKRSDERIREDVCDCLTDAGHLDASEIEVKVSDGEVTLSGSVENRDDKRRAEDLAERVSGVRDVHNSLKVQAKASAMNAMGMGSEQQAGKGRSTTQQRS